MGCARRRVRPLPGALGYAGIGRRDLLDGLLVNPEGYVADLLREHERDAGQMAESCWAWMGTQFASPRPIELRVTDMPGRLVGVLYSAELEARGQGGSG